jgi:uncharacterized protein (DUF952 family)
VREHHDFPCPKELRKLTPPSISLIGVFGAFILPRKGFSTYLSRNWKDSDLRFMAETITIYKVLRPAEYSCLLDNQHFIGSAVDTHDGYIHFSTHDQLSSTIEKHFSELADIVILGVNTAKLPGRLLWETSRGGALFPHLYDAPLPLLAVESTWTRAEWESLQS